MLDRRAMHHRNAVIARKYYLKCSAHWHITRFEWGQSTSSITARLHLQATGCVR